MPQRNPGQTNAPPLKGDAGVSKIEGTGGTNEPNLKYKPEQPGEKKG